MPPSAMAPSIVPGTGGPMSRRELGEDAAFHGGVSFGRRGAAVAVDERFAEASGTAIEGAGDGRAI